MKPLTSEQISPYHIMVNGITYVPKSYVTSLEQNLRWIKATERLPQHMTFQHLKVNGSKYAGYYDYSIKKFLVHVGDRGFDVQDVEWLDESSDSLTYLQYKEQKSE